MQEFVDHFPEISGNAVNGLGEADIRPPSPFFWHPPSKQSHGDLQSSVIGYLHRSPEIAEVFSPTPPGGRGPKPVRQADVKIEKSEQAWTADVKAFALANEADLVGVAPLDPLFVYEGYELNDPWVIVLGVAMDFDELSQAPASFENPTAGVVVGKEYNRASRAARKLSNFILEKGHYAKPWPGPYASALSMMPAAIAAGIGTLGKHGSLINEEYGSSFRLSAVTTEMPLLPDSPKDIGSEDFCLNCQICTNACPPQAISNEKQMVRGVEKYYVDFDKCIPYFGETLGCGVCLAVCPWSRPGRGPVISAKMLSRRARRENTT